jgi:hypothetical protein
MIQVFPTKLNASDAPTRLPGVPRVRLRSGSSLALLFGLFATISACGGAAGSGVDRNKQLTALDDTEKKKMCDAFAKKVEIELPQDLVCRPTGALAGFQAGFQLGNIKEACKEATADCLAMPRAAIQCDAESLKDFPSCEAKVGQLEDCGADYVNVLGDYVGQFPTCDGLVDFLAKATADQLEGLAETPESPASCTALPKACDFPPAL